MPLKSSQPETGRLRSSRADGPYAACRNARDTGALKHASALNAIMANGDSPLCEADEGVGSGKLPQAPGRKRGRGLFVRKWREIRTLSKNWFDLAFGPGRFAKTAYRLREGVLPDPRLSLVAQDSGE